MTSYSRLAITMTLYLLVFSERELTHVHVRCMLALIMVALCNRADHYIFALWLLSFYLLLFPLVSDIAIFVLKRDVKLQLTN